MRMYLFGSRVWGQPESESDIDILVVAQPGAVTLCDPKWTEELTQLLGVQAHLNNYQTAEHELVQRIKDEGVVAFSRYGTEQDFDIDEDIEVDMSDET